MMDSGDLVENGLTVPTTLDSANKEVDFKVIETSVAAEDAKNTMETSRTQRLRSSTLRTARLTTLATTRGTLWDSPPQEG